MLGSVYALVSAIAWANAQLLTPGVERECSDIVDTASFIRHLLGPLVQDGMRVSVTKLNQNGRNETGISVL